MSKVPRFSFLFVVALCFTLPMSCGREDAVLNTQASCEEVLCTQELRSLVVRIQDKDQKSIALDSFEVIQLKDGSNIAMVLSLSEIQWAREHGQYPLISDGVLGINEVEQIQFRGFIDGQEVITSDYEVGTDCCHVGLILGSLLITM